MGTSGHWLSRVKPWCIISLVIFNMTAFHAGVMDFSLISLKCMGNVTSVRSVWLEHPNSTAHTQIHPVPLFSVLQNTCCIKSLETTQMCRLKAKSAPHVYCLYECSWICHRVQIHCTQHGLTYKGAFVPCRDKSAFLWLDKKNSGENGTILYGNVVCWSKCEYMYQPVCVEMLGHCGICLVQLLYSDQPLTYEYLWCVPFVVTVDAPTLDIRKHYKDRCCTLWVGFSAVRILLRYSVAPSGFSDVETVCERTEVLLTDDSLYLSSVIYCLSLWWVKYFRVCLALLHFSKNDISMWYTLVFLCSHRVVQTIAFLSCYPDLSTTSHFHDVSTKAPVDCYCLFIHHY